MNTGVFLQGLVFYCNNNRLAAGKTLIRVRFTLINSSICVQALFDQLIFQSKLHQPYGIVYAQFGDEVLAVGFYRAYT